MAPTDVLGITRRLFARPGAGYLALLMLLFAVAVISYLPFLNIVGPFPGWGLIISYSLIYVPMTLIAVVWILIYHYMAGFFARWRNPFAAKLSRGFRLVFFSSLAVMIIGVLSRLVQNAALWLFIHGDIGFKAYASVTGTYSLAFLSFSVAASCAGLYGGYVLVSALKDYQRMERERLEAQAPPPSQ